MSMAGGQGRTGELAGKCQRPAWAGGEAGSAGTADSEAASELRGRLVPWGEGQVLGLNEIVAGGADPDAVRGAVVGRRGPLDAGDCEDRVGRE
jgi:hypothetical protein